MRIGFFTDTYLPVIHGVEVSIETFRKNLEKMGHEVFIFAPQAIGYKDKNPRVFRFRSIKVIKKPEMRLALPFLPKDTFEKVLNLKLDIAHAHTPFSMGLFARYVANYQKIPLVYTHHTHYPEYAKFYLKERIITPLLARYFSAWFANQAQAILVPSYKMKRFLLEYGVKRTKPIHILPTGVNLEIFKKSKEGFIKIRKKLKIPFESKVLLFVGRMGEEKNPSFLLYTMEEILKKFNNVFLLMVGDGPILEKLKNLALKLKIEKNVIFTGAIPHSKIPAYYQAANAFVFSSQTETQGIVILEAIASGLPVVALKDEAFREMVVENKNGFLIKKASPKSFAKKVLEILKNSSLCKKFSLNSQKIASLFSEKSQAKKLIKIYKSLLKG